MIPLLGPNCVPIIGDWLIKAVVEAEFRFYRFIYSFQRKTYFNPFSTKESIPTEPRTHRSQQSAHPGNTCTCHCYAAFWKNAPNVLRKEMFQFVVTSEIVKFIINVLSNIITEKQSSVL